MNAVTTINVALHALLLSALGWVLVRWCVKDARHRAWASLLTVTAAVIAPVLMEWGLPIAAPQQPVPEMPASSWKLDWKIPAEVASTVRLSPVTGGQPEPKSTWSLHEVAAWFCRIWIAGGILLALRHAYLSLAARRWRLSLRTLSKEAEDMVPSGTWRRTLRVSQNGGCPCVVGLRSPVIAVPRQIIGTWTQRQWQWLLRHEGEHVRGRDTLTAWCLGWVKAGLWWNPFVHLLVEAWSQAREEICDRAAVSASEESTAYTSFLLDIAANARAHSPALLHMAASRPARRLRARMVALLALRPVRGSVSLLFALGSTVVLLSAAALVSCVGLQAADPAAQTSGAQQTRVFKVPPDFLPPGLTAMDLLTTLTIPFPDGASAVFNPATSQLIVRNTAANLERVEEELKALKGEQAVRSTQVYISTKWVQINTSLPASPVPVDLKTVGQFDGEDTTILTDPQFQAVIRALSQRRGVDLMMAPSVTARPGQRAVVEAVREYNGTEFVAQSPQRASTGPLDFIGVRNELLATFEGHKIKIESHSDLGEVDARPAWSAKPGENLPKGAKIVHLRKSKTVLLEDGHTMAVEMGRSPREPDNKVLLFITAQLIDPTGTTLDPGGAVARARAATALQEKTKTMESKGDAALKDGTRLAADGKKEEARQKLQEAFRALSIVRHMQGPVDPHSGDQKNLETRLRVAEEALGNLGYPVRKSVPEVPKPPQIPISIEVKTVEITHKDDTDFLRLLMADAPVQPASPPDLSKLPPEDQKNFLTPADIPPGLFTVAGVFTPGQYAQLIRGMSQRKEAKVTSYPVFNGMNGKTATIPEQAEEPLDLTVKVEPVVGPDGYTIDLSIQITDHRFAEVLRQTNVTTAITLWNGQTVVLGGLVKKDEKGSLSRLVFISVKMAEPKKEKPTKASKPSP